MAVTSKWPAESQCISDHVLLYSYLYVCILSMFILFFKPYSAFNTCNFIDKNYNLYRKVTNLILGRMIEQILRLKP